MMNKFRDTLRQRKFALHLTALLLMLLPPVPMYFAAQNGETTLIWFLIGFVVLGNLIAIIVP
jgi:hypothetical protein